MNFKLIIFFVFISCSVFAQESILKDQSTLQKIEYGLDNLYNYQFDTIVDIEQNLNINYPDNPLPPLFHAIRIYWEYFPVTPNSYHHELFIYNISESIQRSEQILEQDDKNNEAAFLNLMGRLLIMQYYADNHQSSKVIPHIRQAYSMVKKGFELNDEIPDFNFSTGLYNYYRDAYPEKHPVYKPIAYFFKEGNKKLGIKQLEDNWKNGIFLDAESLSFLVYISLNFEGNYKKSVKYTRELYKTYPNNPLYISYKIRTLLLLKRYLRAEQLINELAIKANSNTFFQMMINIYQGIIEEKKYKNYEKAEKLYQSAIELAKPYQPFANDRLSYAYFGLSRIYKKSNPEKSKELRNMAEDLSSYKHLTFD